MNLTSQEDLINVVIIEASMACAEKKKKQKTSRLISRGYFNHEWRRNQEIIGQMKT